ncbi:MurR/RpiR family transcriptional regulator [Nesterenkonia ebinurensis]|uniref:MurR/RpiR family transcriptional regulator n=1 Tax=Nesterenkonia ebinurensis TaxID=2608252 RepID=UPI00123CB6C7|nr:MurR/RpiR family transcriptional regulator [Nesterenkonia ebinurensis]
MIEKASGDQQEAQRIDAELSTPAARFSARFSARPATTQLQQRIIRHERNQLTEFLEELEGTEAIARAASMIVAARRRFLAGSGRSHIFARLLEFDLSVGLGQVSLVDDTHIRMLDVLTDVRSSDVLIVFSLRRFRSEVTRFLHEYHARGGKIVVITNSQDSPAVQYAEEAIFVPTRSESYTDSGIGVVAVSQLLAALATSSAKGARRRLAEREELIEAMEIYR